MVSVPGSSSMNPATSNSDSNFSGFDNLSPVSAKASSNTTSLQGQETPTALKDSVVGRPFFEPLPFGFVQQLRNDVLTCPLIVDCVLDAESQDIVYNLPRFDGHPPTSPDFLRMVLIEGCSVLIKDHTSLLFREYHQFHEKQRQRRERFENAHAFLMNGLVVAAASAAFFLGRRK
jgi:hypothetical protein